tara:strand:- start:166078 stop:166620 length:543 start_codon:yes stop_codon:yes gene_type:complete
MKSKLLPIVAGLVVVTLLGGLAMGIRTRIELSPSAGITRTTKSIYRVIPINQESTFLWFANIPIDAPIDGEKRMGPSDWKLMHEFNHSAAGTTIEHTQWGVVGDTIEPWGQLELEPATRSRLNGRTNALITSGESPRTLQAMTLEINKQLLAHLQLADPGPTPADIDAIFDQVTSEIALP